MMQFTQVDDDAYDVRMNLDAIERIGNAFQAKGEAVQLDSRDTAIGQGFKSAHARFSEPEVSEETSE